MKVLIRNGASYQIIEVAGSTAKVIARFNDDRFDSSFRLIADAKAKPESDRNAMENVIAECIGVMLP